MRMASGPNAGHYTGSFGAQLDPCISGPCRCRGLEQHYVIASVSAGSLENKNPLACGSVPGGEDEFSHDAFPGQPGLGQRTAPFSMFSRHVPGADLPRLSGHELTS
jgi:hypothetical protein